MMQTPATSAGRLNWRTRYPALTYPNYRLWFLGQMVSLFGTWMQMTAQGYLIFELTHSAAYLGYASFASGLPTWLFTLYGGVIADRLPRRNLLVITQTCMMTLALILATLTALHLVQPWHILVLAFLLGVANAFDAPARQAFTLEMVERHDLANAIALNSTMFNSASAVGPAVGGMTYSLVGPSWCFFLNGASFIAIIVSLLLMKLKPHVKPVRSKSTLGELGDGLRYAAGQPIVRTILLLMATISLFAMSYGTLMPAWAVRILNGDATTNGLLQSARGSGALISALVVASMGRFRAKGKLLTASTFALPIVLLLFSQARWLPLSLLLLAGVGLSHMPIMMMANTLVQTQVPDALRGRVMSLYTIVFMGMMPLGNLQAGTIASRFGAPFAVGLGATVCALAALLILWRLPQLRRLE